MLIRTDRKQLMIIKFRNQEEENRFNDLLLPMLKQGGWADQEELIIDGQPIAFHCIEDEEEGGNI